jgi:hypothetical protein
MQPAAMVDALQKGVATGGKNASVPLEVLVRLGPPLTALAP